MILILEAWKLVQKQAVSVKEKYFSMLGDFWSLYTFSYLKKWLQVSGESSSCVSFVLNSAEINALTQTRDVQITKSGTLELFLSQTFAGIEVYVTAPSVCPVILS